MGGWGWGEMHINPGLQCGVHGLARRPPAELQSEHRREQPASQKKGLQMVPALPILLPILLPTFFPILLPSLLPILRGIPASSFPELLADPIMALPHETGSVASASGPHRGVQRPLETHTEPRTHSELNQCSMDGWMSRWMDGWMDE